MQAYRHIQDMLCTWQLCWLAADWPLSALDDPLLTLLTQTGVEITPIPL